jgi:hypothetical protein
VAWLRPDPLFETLSRRRRIRSDRQGRISLVDK